MRETGVAEETWSKSCDEKESDGRMRKRGVIDVYSRKAVSERMICDEGRDETSYSSN